MPFLSIIDLKTFFDTEHRREIPCIIGKYLLHCALFCGILLLILYPVALFFFTTDHLWFFSVFYLFFQALPLLFFMCLCSCVATCHFVTSTGAFLVMAVIQIIAAFIMISLSIAVTVVWLVYSSVFFWELFLATLLPGLFSFFTSFFFVGLAVGEISRFRYRKRFDDYVPDYNVNMVVKNSAGDLKKESSTAQLTTPEESVADLNVSSDSIHASDIDLLSIDSPIQPVYKTDLGRKRSTPSVPAPLTKKSSTSSVSSRVPTQEPALSKLVEEKSVPADLRVDWRQYVKKKAQPANQDIYQQFLKSHERGSQASSTESNLSAGGSGDGESSSGRRPHPAVEKESSDDDAFGVIEDVSFEATPPKSKWGKVKEAMIIPKNVDMGNDSSPSIGRSTSRTSMHPSSSLNSSSANLQSVSSRASFNRQPSMRAPLERQNSSLTASRSARDLGFLSTRERSVAKFSEKELMRIQYERQQAAGKDWERFVQREKKRGREPTWENFEKENVVVTSPFALQRSPSGVPGSGLPGNGLPGSGLQGANKIAMIARLKMKFRAKEDQGEMQILQELSEKYNLPLKQVKQLHSELVKKFGPIITRKQIKSSLNASTVSRNMLNSILRIADRDSDGNSVSVANWMRFMFRFRFGTVQEKFGAAFQIFDYDGSGELQFSELFSLVSAFASHNVSKAQKKAITARIFKQIDEDGSNAIDIKEFIAFGAANVGGFANDLDKMFTDFFRPFFV